MSFSTSLPSARSDKKRSKRIPKETLRLKGQRSYNQRNTASLLLTPRTKKQLVALGLLSRILKNASIQRKKLKGLKKHFARKETKSEVKNMCSTLEISNSHLAVEIAEHHKTCTQHKLSVDVIVRKERRQVENVKSRQRLMSKEREESHRLVNEVKETIEYIKRSETFKKRDSENRKRSQLARPIEEKNRHDFDKMEVLLNQRNFKIGLIMIDVYNITDNTEVDHPDNVTEVDHPDNVTEVDHPDNVTEVEHPDSVEGISWSLFREEKYRLLSFVRYPLTAVKSAVLLAEDGFVYTGKGEAMDDSVTCYFCCVHKNRWKTNDVITDIHREISPNCSMITKNNCDNIPLRTSRHDGQNFGELLNQLNSNSNKELNQNLIQETANKEHEKHGNFNHHSRDIDADSEKISIQNDSTLNRPTTTKGNTPLNRDLNAEDMRRGTLVTNTSTLTNLLTTQVPTSSTGLRQTNTSTLTNLLTTQVPTSTSGQRQTDSSNIAVQPKSSSSSLIQNVPSFPSSQQITLPHISTELRNTGRNNVTSTSNSGQTSIVLVEQPSVGIASSTSHSSNSNTIAQTSVAIASSTSPSSNRNTIAQTSVAIASTSQSSNSATVAQTSVAIASSTSQSSNSATFVQTSTTNGEKKSGKGPSYAELGIITERPKRPEYAVKETRLKTFDKWPAHHHLTPEDLSDAGLYYAGYGDCARCFYCGGGLRNWEDEDDVWVEHARWFPKCAYIRQQMGQIFVDTVQELNKTLDVITFAMVKDRCKAPGTAASLDAKLEPLTRDPAVLTVVDIGYSLTDVLQVAKIIKGKDVILSSDVLLSKLQELKKEKVTKTSLVSRSVTSSSTTSQDEEALRQLKERNNQLRQQAVCKICMDKEVAVVFLPCGHLVSCAECASAMKDCPVCRVNVKGVVRAFL